jgi:regulator of replication initiation timing
LEEEINELYDRLTQALKAENARLSEENEALRLEIQRLQKRFS